MKLNYNTAIVVNPWIRLWQSFDKNCTKLIGEDVISHRISHEVFYTFFNSTAVEISTIILSCSSLWDKAQAVQLIEPWTFFALTSRCHICLSAAPCPLKSLEGHCLPSGWAVQRRPNTCYGRQTSDFSHIRGTNTGPFGLKRSLDTRLQQMASIKKDTRNWHSSLMLGCFPKKNTSLVLLN